MATRPELALDIICPVCGGANDAHAVFCANPSCQKALGEFRYVLEELGKDDRWHRKLIDRISAFVGKPHFVGIHVFLIATWILTNTLILSMASRFDSYPFGLLGLVLSVEAIMITSILIISNRAQSALADKRAELDYEINVQTYREIVAISHRLADINERLEAIEKRS